MKAGAKCFLLLIGVMSLWPASSEASVCAWVIGLRKGIASRGSMDYIDSAQRYDTLNKEGRALLNNVLDHLVWLESVQAGRAFREEYVYWQRRFASAPRYIALQAQVNDGLHKLEFETQTAQRRALRDQIFDNWLPELERLAKELNVPLVSLSFEVSAQNRLLAELTAGQEAALSDAFRRYAKWAEQAVPGEASDDFIRRAATNPGALGYNLRVVNSWSQYAAKPTGDSRAFFFQCLQEKMDRRYDSAPASGGGGLPLTAHVPRRVSLVATYRWISAVVERHKILSAKGVRTPWEEMELSRAGILVDPIERYRVAREVLHETAVISLYGQNPEASFAQFNALDLPSLCDGVEGFRDAVAEYKTLTSLDEQFRLRLPENVQRALEDMENGAEISPYALRLGLAWRQAADLAASYYQQDLDFFHRANFPDDVEAALAELVQIVEGR